MIVDFMDRRLVLEEGVFGWSMRTLDSLAAHDRIVDVITPSHPIDVGIQKSFDWLGQRYDYIGLFGMFFVMVARWFKKKIRNPLSSSTSMWCSEAGAKILQISGYPGAEKLDPPTTTPEDLRDFLRGS
jgi:hypothetical protein